MMKPASSQCRIQPSVFFLILTLLVTITATGLLCTAIMTDHWEFVTWDRGKLDDIADSPSQESKIDWFLNGKVARVNLSGAIKGSPFVFAHLPDNPPALYLTPMYGSLWTICNLITEDEFRILRNLSLNIPTSSCTHHLATDIIKGIRTDWQHHHRLQNLSISCALVCLIILGCSALVGAFGVFEQQISAVLVTGVMYLLAATFGFFTLAIIHFKRAQCPTGKTNQTTLGLKVDGVLVPTTTNHMPFLLGDAAEYFTARILSTDWGIHMGWGGVGTCLLVSVLWILLSKIMRYNPLTTMLAFF